MIDLATLRRGDDVKLRCGGVLKIRDIYKSSTTYDDGLWAVDFTIFYGLTYFNNGVMAGQPMSSTPFDIVETIQPPKAYLERENL